MKIDLDEIERLAQAAPRGPWQLQIKEVDMGGYFSVQRKIEGMRETVIPNVNEIGPDASAFISAANPTVVLDLIETLRATELRANANAEMFKGLLAENAKLRGFVPCACGDEYPVGSEDAKHIEDHGRCVNCQMSEDAP